MIPRKEQTPFVPISPEEIVEDVFHAYEKGISMAHIHARDAVTQESVCKQAIYGQIIEGIRKYAPDRVICVSLSGRTFNEFEHRADPLELDGNLKPDMVSLTLSSLNFNKQTSMNSPDMIVKLAGRMNERNIKPELEAFDLGMINYAKYLIRKNLLLPPFYINLILGNIACAQADLLHAGMMVNDLPENSIWSLGGIGGFQMPMNSVAISTGGGVRVGLEDNIWYDGKRKRLAKNIDLINRIHTIAETNEREIMPPCELRKKLKLAKGFGIYGTAA